jgi:hypothetical protein
MTEIQLIHHAEQMESARREFAEIWKKIEPFCDVAKVGTLPPIGVLCWKTFLLSKGLLK